MLKAETIETSNRTSACMRFFFHFPRSFFSVAATLIVFFASPTSSSAALISDRLSLHQFVQTETAYRVAASPAFTKLLHFYQVDARYKLSRKIGLTAVGRLSYDAIYDLEALNEINPFQNRFASSTPREIPGVDPFEAALREFYADFFFPKADFRIGRQIARWGVIEGFRITDELNPLDFSEFILRPLTDRYIPLWMAKGEFYFQGAALGLVWIPDLTFHRAADPGTEWEQFQTPPGLAAPAQTLAHSEFGLRFSTYAQGADLAFSYLDVWDDFPTASRTIFGLGGNIAQRTAGFTPRYHRLRTLGFSAARGIGGDLFKGELAYVFGKHFGTFPIDADGDGVSDIAELKRDHLKYALGWDTRVGEKVDTFIQFFQQWIFNYSDLIIADEVESGASVLFQREFLYNRLLVKCLILYIFNDGDAMIRPRVEYQWSDHMRLSFGADLFEGSAGNIQADDFHFIGFFDSNDRIYAEVRYSF